MARARLEYDDSGSTFYYFLLSFYGLILIPITYFLLPRRKKAGDDKECVCQCDPCLAKKDRINIKKPNKWFATYSRYAVLAILWGILVFMLYKVVAMDKDYIEYDPFEILQLDPGASMSEIRKQYRKLSKVFHPDKQGGDQDMFMKIAKAYEALTDEVSRENWEKYGNPDGPQAASFGIALPSWIVDKQNSLWVLAVYMGIFMVGLPLIVGVWWYRSIKYGSTNVLIQTTKFFGFHLYRSRTMPVKRILMILTAAFEFNKDMSPLLPSRPSDNMELSKIILSKTLPHVCAKSKERYIGMPYAIKARILLHSHLERVPLHSTLLELDQEVVLSKCPQLLQEMINILIQLWAYKSSRKEPPPSLDLFEEVMKASGIIVQAMWLSGNSPLLQLPHLTQPNLRHFKTKKRNISSIDQFCSLPPSERRSLVRTLSDEQYSDIIAVCKKFPQVTIKAQSQVVDDEDTNHITVSSVVTLSVTLTRTNLLEEDDNKMPIILSDLQQGEEVVETLHEGEGNGNPVAIVDTPTIKKLKKVSGPVRKKVKGQAKPRRRTVNPKKVKKGERSRRVEETLSDDEEEEVPVVKGVEERGRRKEKISEDSESEGNGDDEGTPLKKGQGRGEDKDEEEWHRLQQSLQKHSKKPDLTATQSHPVHAPYYPEEKQELWWLYVADRKRKDIICPPMRISGLMKEYMTDLHFTAPDKPGHFRYNVVLRSDSYLDLFFSQDIKLNVGAHQEVSGREQWAELEKEEEEEELIEESLSEADSWDPEESD